MAVTDEKASLVLSGMLKGLSLSKSLEENGVDSRTFFDALNDDTKLAQLYLRARQVRAELLVDEIISIADTDSDAQRARNRIDVRKWYASKMQPQQYGDRIDMTITNTVDISLAISEAKARALSVLHPKLIEQKDPEEIAEQDIFA